MTYGNIIDALGACHRGFGSCMQAANGDWFRMALCTGQLGVCTAMNALDCSKDVS